MDTIQPRCPYCNAQGLTHLAKYQAGNFVVVYCGQCGAIYGVVPSVAKEKFPSPSAKEEVPPPVEETAAPSEPPPSPLSSIEKPPDFIQQIGQADLKHKVPYSPERLAAVAMSAGLNRGSMYRHFPLDGGPPICSLCKVEMQQFTIPEGHKNSGVKVWVCQTFGCKEWELVDG